MIFQSWIKEILVSVKKLIIGLSYFGCECNDSDDANIAQYFKVLLLIAVLKKQTLFPAYPPQVLARGTAFYLKTNHQLSIHKLEKD